MTSGLKLLEIILTVKSFLVIWRIFPFKKGVICLLVVRIHKCHFAASLIIKHFFASYFLIYVLYTLNEKDLEINAVYYTR